ncbi:MAG: oxidoreductase [Rhizobiales bacterium]|nr:oxidoreductase [Hyphomicrobiales bacterium]
MSRIPVVVDAIDDVAADVRLLSLRAANGEPLPPAGPGDHVDLFLREGLVRQYSLTNGPDDRAHYHLAVKREPASRGGSVYVHDDLVVGSQLQISAPRNNFLLDKGAGPALLFAGGIGITPILSMVRYLYAAERVFDLSYFVRDEGSALFQGELRAYDGSQHLYLAHGPDDTRKVVDEALASMTEAAHVYVCGPAAFMDCVLDSAVANGFPPEAFHMESFTAAGIVENSDTFEVKLAKAGLTVIVGADETIAEALLREGFEVELSCEQGICGTCCVKVLEGVPKHEDQFFTDGEKEKGDQICVCVSRSLQGPLLLDL